MKAVVVVAALHALLGYALVTGLALEVAQQASDRLKIFDVTEPPPPPPEEIPDPAAPKAPEPEGAAAPESMEAVVVPEPEVWLAIAPTIPTVPVAGTSDVPGTGTGSGGEGTGTGSGASGTGTGGGGTGAQRIRGAFDYEDLPRSARERFARGAVGVRFVVQPNGRVTGCAVTRSSGDAVLDETTCRLIERRFRYRPARNAAGQAVAETVRTIFEWIPTSGR